MCHLKSQVELMSSSEDAVSGVKATENLSCAVELVPVTGDMTDMDVLCGSQAGTVAVPCFERALGSSWGLRKWPVSGSGRAENQVKKHMNMA